MKGSDIFPSKYIKADDLNGRDVAVAIDHADIEKLGDEAKLVLYFKNKEKGMICNKTNFNRIAYLYGDETDDWPGKEIVLTSEFVEFQGKTVKGLRVRAPKRQTHISTGRVPTKAESENPGSGVALDDDIPFAPEWRG